MLGALLMLGGAWAEDTSVPSLSTQIKRGLSARIQSENGRVHITRVRMFPAVVDMSEAEIAAHLASDDPLPVGIMETRDHGRLRISCHHDTCTGASGSATVEITLLREPPDEPRRTGARPANDS